MIEIKNLCKTYSLTDGSVEALKDVSLSIPDGDVFGIIGMSGAGKSTLVRCINMLERPTAGSVVIDGKDLTKMTEKELRAERQSITMIFQGFNLAKRTSVLNNVMMGRLHSSPMWRTLLGAWSAEDTELGMQAYNILEGFEGALNDQAQRGHLSGWRRQGLPWRQG